jgi:hypothetical protein
LSKWLRIPKCISRRNRFDEECVTWAKSRIRECIDEHDHKPITDPFCPERLIDVQSRPIKLVLTDSITPNSEHGNSNLSYAALSYCWGSAMEASDQLTCTTHSLPLRLSAINDQELSPVLSDAISVTRSLSIPYLWVDSLCILQDSLADWERQSSLMGKIYGNAMVTIGALASKSCNNQFICSIAPELYISYYSNDNIDPEGTLRFRYLLCERTRLWGKSIGNIVFVVNRNDSRYNSRGWTYQEFL